MKSSDRVYHIRDIRARRTQNGVKYYCVLWEDYSDSEFTWEPVQHFNNCSIIHEFDAKLDGLTIEAASRGCLTCPKVQEMGCGSFKQGDTVEQVMAYKKRKQGIFLKVRWQPRKTGLVPRYTWVESDELKVRAPLELLQFYQRKARWVVRQE